MLSDRHSCIVYFIYPYRLFHIVKMQFVVPDSFKGIALEEILYMRCFSSGKL